MTLEQIRKRLSELRNRLETLQGELRSMPSGNAFGDSHARRSSEIDRELNTSFAEGETRGLLDEIERLEQSEQAMVRAAGGTGMESSSAHGTYAAAHGATRSGSGPFGDQQSSAFATLRSARHLGDQLADTVAGMVERDVESPLTAIYAAAAADPAYARAFGKLCRDPMNGHRSFSTEELYAYQRAEHALRALNLSTGAAMLPTHLDASILLSSAGSTSPFREIARVERGVHQTYTSVSSEGVSTDWTGEAVEVSDNSPSFANPVATAFKATSFVPISFEALGDMALDGVGGAPVGHTGSSELDRLFSDERMNHENTAFVSGNGTNRPRGLITALDANTNAEVETTTSNVFGSVDVYNTIEALPPRFRPNASWAMNLSFLNTIDQFETGNGAKLFPEAGAANPVILRRRAYEVSDMDGEITTGSEENIVVVGDFRHYLIYDRVPSQLELVPHLFGTTNGRPTGQRGFLYWWRVGANTTVDTAFRVLQAHTNA